MKLLLTSITATLSLLTFAQQSNNTVDINGTNRTYVQYLPTGFDAGTESLPVVFCLHGIGDVATNMANIGFNQMADTARFIAIYPQGLPNAFSQNSWNNGTLLASTADDLTFLNALINDMLNTYNANASRIYMCGFSMGGIMTYHMACELNDRIAAIGSMSGAMPSSDLTACAPTYKTPLIHFHGDADATIPYDASPLPSLALATESIEFWRNEHTCATTSDSTRLADTGSDGYTVDQLVYQSCTPASSVEHFRINGADHQYFYEPVNDFTEAIEIWRFFYQWSHSSPAAAGITNDKLNRLQLFPNPAVNELTISGTGDLQISALNGRIVLEQRLEQSENSINISKLEQGIYIVRLNDSEAKLVKL